MSDKYEVSFGPSEDGQFETISLALARENGDKIIVTLTGRKMQRFQMPRLAAARLAAEIVEALATVPPPASP